MLQLTRSSSQLLNILYNHPFLARKKSQSQPNEPLDIIVRCSNGLTRFAEFFESAEACHAEARRAAARLGRRLGRVVDCGSSGIVAANFDFDFDFDLVRKSASRRFERVYLSDGLPAFADRRWQRRESGASERSAANNTILFSFVTS